MGYDRRGPALTDYEEVQGDSVLMIKGGREWARAWQSLRFELLNTKFKGDRSKCLCPESGERWQYMGTEWVKNHGGWLHVFRHRHHPVTKGRRVVYIDAYIKPSAPNLSKQHKETA
jgi:hypothetical protein